MNPPTTVGAHTPLLQTHNGQAMADSLGVAEHFGKQHKDVLKAVENLECSEEFGRRNFAPTSYKDSWNREQPMMLMSRDGFCFLVMGFTGREAARWKEKYIAAFNEMEAGFLMESSRQSGRGILEDLEERMILPYKKQINRQGRELTQLRKLIHAQNKVITLLEREVNA